MKKNITLLLMLLSPLCFIAQDTILDIFKADDVNFKKIKLHHLKKMQSAEVKILYANLGNAYEINYGYLVTDNAFFHVGFNYEQGKLSYSTFDYKNIRFGLSYTALKIKQRVYINPDISLHTGFITAKNSDLNIEQQYFYFGGSIGLNTEVYILNKLSLILTADQQYNFKDKFGNMHYNVGGGLRYYFK